MTNEKPYNPLERKNLGASVAEALLERLPIPLGNVPKFQGAGIYAIYYTGDFPCYTPIAQANRDDKFQLPIYVGKAVPEGARKGRTGKGSETSGSMLKRLKEHATSIRKAENLNLEDFYCRYLVVEDIWIPLGESLLIAKFSPIWNTLIDGFGNHNPGGGRYEQLRSRWDVLHPGRPGALKCKPREETAEQIATEVGDYLRSQPTPEHLQLFGDEDFGE